MAAGLQLRTLEMCSRQLPPPSLPKPRLQKEIRDTLVIHIDLEDIGVRGNGWWCL